MIYSEENLDLFREKLAQAAGVQIQETPYYKMLTIPHFTYPNLLFEPNFDIENPFSIIQNIQQQADKFPRTIIASPLKTSENTISILNKYAAVSKFWAAMTCDLNHLPNYKANESFHFKKITDLSNIVTWCKLVEQGLMGGLEIDKNMFFNLSQYDNFYFYLAYFNNQPVATALNVIQDKTVGVYFITTLESFRGQGIGKKTTVFALEKAKQLGAKIAHLQATELGEPVYKKVGFRKMCDIPVFRI